VLLQDAEPTPDYALDNWIDYYSFTSLYGGLQIYAVDWYEFFGQPTSYPNYYVANPNINMGRTHSRKKVGRPHHFRFVSETYENSCGGLLRNLVYQVVDVNNRAVGKVAVIESFDGSIINSCTGTQADTTSDYLNIPAADQGKFIDHLSAGCPRNGADASCGLDVIDHWQWCKVGSIGVTLASLQYSVHYNRITVNGRVYLTPGEYLYP